MKRGDLIKQVMREDMPDLEKVRENCHRQDIPRQTPRLRWSTVAVIAACALLLAGTVYAAGVILSERLDTGGLFEFVLVHEDDPYYLEWRRENLRTAVIIYESPNSNLPFFVRLHSSGNPRFEPEQAAAINAMLAGILFAQDGSPFPYDLVGVYADTRGQYLFNADNEEIGSIQVLLKDTMPIDISVLTVAELCMLNSFNNTFEDAVAMLGTDFRLPTVHMDGFDSPMFQSWQNDYMGVGLVYVIYLSPDECEIMLIMLEAVREEGGRHMEVLFSGEVERFYAVYDTEIYKLTGGGMATHYTWVHNGLVYTFILPTRLICGYTGEFEYVFTDGQIREIIGSMIQ